MIKWSRIQNLCSAGISKISESLGNLFINFISEHQFVCWCCRAYSSCNKNKRTQQIPGQDNFLPSYKIETGWSQGWEVFPNLYNFIYSEQLYDPLQTLPLCQAEIFLSLLCSSIIRRKSEKIIYAIFFVVIQE